MELSKEWLGLLVGGAIVHVAMALLWKRSLASGNAGIVDAGWTAAVAALAALHAALGAGDGRRRLALAAIAFLWGGRLFVHLVARLRREPEDGRYRSLRARFGGAAPRFFFWFFQLQALLAVLLSLSPFALARLAAPLPTGALQAAFALFVLSITGESVADAQLARFRADPANRGRTCRIGLWRWSRHPNYFFEWLHWGAYVPLAWGSVTIAAPLAVAAAMVLLILFVSGIPPTEAQALKSRGDDYRAYQRTTSAFVPWPPQKEAP